MSASETMITEAAQALYREETNQDISGDARPTWGSLGLGQESYRELAAAAIDAAEPLIREQIATELRRNRVASAKTPYSQGYRDGYNDAADQVQHGGDAALSDHTPSTGGRGSLPRLAHDFQGVSGHPDDDECTYREDGTDATYCGRPEADHG